jgi:hypothetical protein
MAYKYAFYYPRGLVGDILPDSYTGLEYVVET